MSEYHVREWLNPEGKFATATITAFHGANPWDETYTNCTRLVIASCHDTAHLHPFETDKDLHPFINKVRMIANVCADFADHLIKCQHDRDFIEYLEQVSINEKDL